MFGWFWKLIGWKKKIPTLLCISQADTFWWPPWLDERMEATCDNCGTPIFYEKKNGWIDRKVCNRCTHP